MGSGAAGHLLLVAAAAARQPWPASAANPPRLAAGVRPGVQAVARERTAALAAKDAGLRFRYGFHASPSLRQLHLHVVSQVCGLRGRGVGVAGPGACQRLACLLLRPPRCTSLIVCRHALTPTLPLTAQDFASAGLKHKKHWWVGG